MQDEHGKRYNSDNKIAEIEIDSGFVLPVNNIVIQATIDASNDEINESERDTKDNADISIVEHNIVHEQETIVNNDNDSLLDTLNEDNSDAAQTERHAEGEAEGSNVNCTEKQEPEKKTQAQLAEEALEEIVRILQEADGKDLNPEELKGLFDAALPSSAAVIFTSPEEIEKAKNVPVMKYTGTICGSQVSNAKLQKIVSSLNEAANKAEKPFVFSAVAPDAYASMIENLMSFVARGKAEVPDLPRTILSPALIVSEVTGKSTILHIYETYDVKQDAPANLWDDVSSLTGLNVTLDSSESKRKSMKSERLRRAMAVAMNAFYTLAVFVCTGITVWHILAGVQSMTWLYTMFFIVLWFMNKNAFNALFEPMEGHEAVLACGVRAYAKREIKPYEIANAARFSPMQNKGMAIFMIAVLVIMIVNLATDGGNGVVSLMQSSPSGSIWD